MKKAYLAAVAAMAIAGSASAAVTVSTTQSGPPTEDPGFAALGQSLIYDFDTLSPTTAGPGAQLTGNYTIFSTPSGTSQSAPPAGSDPGNKYLSVPNPAVNGSATLLLGDSYRSVSFYWGSIDTYNTVKLFDSANNLLGTFTGGALPPPVMPNGNQGATFSNRRVNFTSTSANIASIQLNSQGFAFEVDTFAGAIPEPATWAMMIGGFGMVGAAMRRRPRRAAVLA